MRKSVHQNSADAKVLSYGFTAAVICVVSAVAVYSAIITPILEAKSAKESELKVMDYINGEHNRLFVFPAASVSLAVM